MKIRLYIILSLLVISATPQAARLPFEIPPSGQPQELIGNMDMMGPTALAFDSRNRPYLFDARWPKHFGYILTLREGKWVKLSYESALRELFPSLRPPSRPFLHARGTIVFDDQDGLYFIITVPKSGGGRSKRFQSVLIYSPDLGESFQAYRLPRGRTSLELRVGHNRLTAPPAISVSVPRQRVSYIKWGRRSRFSVILPRKEGNRLQIPAPVTVSDNALAAGTGHSGGTSFAVTTGRYTHVVYTEVPNSARGGNPTYAATIDRDTGRVVSRTFLVTADPEKPDNHSRPVITVDSSLYLHVIAGSHNGDFHYLRSLKPDATDAGWTSPEVLRGERRTYQGLVCDLDDRLHLVYRAHPSLRYQRRSADDQGWSPSLELVRAPRGHRGYTVFYHRLAIDRIGTLYLAFTFFDRKLRERGDFPQALITSTDGGRTWQLARTRDVAARVVQPVAVTEDDRTLSLGE